MHRVGYIKTHSVSPAVGFGFRNLQNFIVSSVLVWGSVQRPLGGRVAGGFRAVADGFRCGGGPRRRRQTAQSARCRSVTGHGSDARRQCLWREIPDLRGHAFMPCKAVECHEDRWDLLD